MCAIILLLAVATLAMVPLGIAHAQTQDQLRVTSQDLTSAQISGYYTMLSQGGNTVATGFTPAAFTVNSGVSYAVQVDDFGSCHFDHWADTGSMTASRAISISADMQIKAVYNCGTTTSGGGGGGGGGGGSASVTVQSVDQNNNYITGYYTALVDSSGNVIATGFTAKTFTTTAGSAYGIQVDGFGTCSFNHWSDGGANDPRSFTQMSGAMTFTAAFNCGTTTSGGGGGGGGGGGSGGGAPGTLTVYDHRVAATYWASCFATTCTNPTASCTTSCTGPGAGMWIVLYDASGSVVGTGFADENGHTFTGLSAGATYYLYPSDCKLCHGSTHDVNFNHWADGSTTRPLPVTATGMSYNAWYVCTNGCTGY